MKVCGTKGIRFNRLGRKLKILVGWLASLVVLVFSLDLFIFKKYISKYI